MKKIKKEILEKINSNEVKMKPRWWFEVWEDVKIATFAGGVLGICFIIGGISYWSYINNPAKLMDFGSVGWEMIIETFPKILIAAMILIWGVTMSIFGNIKDNYKKPLYKLSLITAVIILIISIVMLWIGRIWEMEILLRLV